MSDQEVFPNYDALTWPIERLGLPRITENSLERARISTVAQLASKTEVWLCQRPGIGWRGVEAIKTKLAEQGLRLDWG